MKRTIILSSALAFGLQASSQEYVNAGLCYYAVRNRRYKLVQNTPFESLQLFDIVSDPFEEKPLGKDRKEFRELTGILSQHIRKSGAVPWQKEKYIHK